MDELVQFQEILPVASDKEFPINARDLWKALQVKTLFKDWIKRRLEDTDAIKDRDYCSILSSLTRHKNGPTKIDYFLTLSLAKEFAMLERNEIGKLIRRYFIYCEEQYKAQQPTHQIPQTLSEALRLAADLEEEKQQALAANRQLEEENKQIKPQAEKWAAFMNSEGNFTFESAAKIVKTGQNRLFALLREKKYLFRNKENHNYNTPYQTKVDAGYFVVKLTTITKGKNKLHTHRCLLHLKVWSTSSRITSILWR